jgi:RNA polymerase sigma factor (sigma-70 family)
MTGHSLHAVVQHIRKITASHEYSELSDAQLLDRFVRSRNESAFTALIQRHGPMVRDLCRRLLRQEADVDDAFQATFLVLLRKARSIRKRASLGSWLYGVAYRIARKLDGQTSKEMRRGRCATNRSEDDPSRGALWRELCSVLDEELNGLSEAYRSALVLCYLQGLTRDEAARQLGWSVRTLKRRLERGRELLLARLSRRGITLSAALLAAGLTEQAAGAALPAMLLQSTIGATCSVMSGNTAIAGSISARAIGLAGASVRGIRGVAIGILKLCIVGPLAVTAVAGLGLLVQRASPNRDSPLGPKGSISPVPPPTQQAMQIANNEPQVERRLSDTKRTKPEVLKPSLFQMQSVRGAVPGAVIVGGPNGKHQVLVLRQNGTGRSKVMRSVYLDLDKVQDTSHLGQDIYPVRMVVVSASFPLKEQLEEFRRALRARSLSDLAKMISNGEAIWGFRPPEIERRTFTEDGNPVLDWQAYNAEIEEAIKFYLARAAQPEREDERMLKHEGIINWGLVMARPRLAHGDYPNTEVQSMMRGAARIEKRAAVDSKAVAADNSRVPDYALVRFIDATVDPGYTYQYRFKVRMADPNVEKHNLANRAQGKDEVISAREFTETPRITVPIDTAWYVMDEKPDKDQLILQIHHWVDFAFTNPDDTKSKAAIGDWTIWDKAPVHRGEYIGRSENVELPTWKIDKETYELALNTKTHSSRIPVDFTTRTSRLEDPVLLLDYSGGKRTAIQLGTKKVTEDVPVEVLVLTPHGKLVVRSQQLDARSNSERQARYTKWKEWMDQVRKGLAGKK